MQLAEALRRVGAQVVKEKIEEEQATFFVRVSIDQGLKWVDAISNFLFSARDASYTLDVSKYFYPSGGEVKYLWRVVITGNVGDALASWAACCMQAHMAHVPEISSFPLVGRVKYPFDPAKGLIKGGHDLEASPGILSMAIGGGVAGGVP